MDVTINWNGNDITNHVTEYTRDQKLCSGIGNLYLTISGSCGVSFTTYDTIIVYEGASKKGIYNIKTVTESGDGNTIELDCQDDSMKMEDYFIPEQETLEDSTTYCSYWIGKYLTEAGVSYIFNTYDNDSVLQEGSQVGYESVADLVLRLCQQCGWHFYFNTDGVCVIGKLIKSIDSPDISLDSNDIESFTITTDDEMARNRAIVWGKSSVIEDSQVFASTTVPTSWQYDSNDVRSIVLENSYIGEINVAQRIANQLVSEYKTLTKEKTFILSGYYNINVTDTVFIDCEWFTGTGLVTSIESKVSASGMITIVVLDQRCPRQIAYFGYQGYVYVSTNGSGIYKKTLPGNTWESFNDGLTDLDIKDISVVYNVCSCVSFSGNAWRRITGTNWVLLAKPLIIDSILGTPPDNLFAIASVVDRTTYHIYVVYNSRLDGTRDNTRSWVVEYTAGGVVVGYRQVSLGGEYWAKSFDIERGYGKTLVSAGLPSTGTVWDIPAATIGYAKDNYPQMTHIFNSVSLTDGNFDLKSEHRMFSLIDDSSTNVYAESNKLLAYFRYRTGLFHIMTYIGGEDGGWTKSSFTMPSESYYLGEDGDELNSKFILSRTGFYDFTLIVVPLLEDTTIPSSIIMTQYSISGLSSGGNVTDYTTTIIDPFKDSEFLIGNPTAVADGNADVFFSRQPALVDNYFYMTAGGFVYANDEYNVLPQEEYTTLGVSIGRIYFRKLLFTLDTYTGNYTIGDVSLLERTRGNYPVGGARSLNVVHFSGIPTSRGYCVSSVTVENSLENTSISFSLNVKIKTYTYIVGEPIPTVKEILYYSSALHGDPNWEPHQYDDYTNINPELKHYLYYITQSQIGKTEDSAVSGYDSEGNVYIKLRFKYKIYRQYIDEYWSASYYGIVPIQKLIPTYENTVYTAAVVFKLEEEDNTKYSSTRAYTYHYKRPSYNVFADPIVSWYIENTVQVYRTFETGLIYKMIQPTADTQFPSEAYDTYGPRFGYGGEMYSADSIQQDKHLGGLPHLGVLSSTTDNASLTTVWDGDHILWNDSEIPINGEPTKFMLYGDFLFAQYDSFVAIFRKSTKLIDVYTVVVMDDDTEDSENNLMGITEYPSTIDNSDIYPLLGVTQTDEVGQGSFTSYEGLEGPNGLYRVWNEKPIENVTDMRVVSWGEGTAPVNGLKTTTNSYIFRMNDGTLEVYPVGGNQDFTTVVTEDNETITVPGPFLTAHDFGAEFKFFDSSNYMNIYLFAASESAIYQRDPSTGMTFYDNSTGLPGSPITMIRVDDAL